MMIDFQVTSRCHLNCKYCFDILKGTPEKDTETLFKSIDKLIRCGVTGLVITGGEPLLRDDIEDVIEYLHQKEIYIYLSTQGNYIRKLRPDVIKLVDCFGIPLDSLNLETNEALGRPRNQSEIFADAYNYIREYNQTAQIKMGTVVNKKNKDEIIDLGCYIQGNYNDAVWRLYQFNPIGNGEKNREELRLSRDEFDGIVENTSRYCGGLNISAMPIEDAENGYFFVGPLMNLLIFEEIGFKDIGLLQELTDDNVKKCLYSDYSEIAKKTTSNRIWVGGKS